MRWESRMTRRSRLQWETPPLGELPGNDAVKLTALRLTTMQWHIKKIFLFFYPLPRGPTIKTWFWNILWCFNFIFILFQLMNWVNTSAYWIQQHLIVLTTRQSAAWYSVKVLRVFCAFPLFVILVGLLSKSCAMGNQSRAFPNNMKEKGKWQFEAKMVSICYPT